MFYNIFPLFAIPPTKECKTQREHVYERLCYSWLQDSFRKGLHFTHFWTLWWGGGSDGEWFDHRSCIWSYIILGRRRASSAFGLRDTVNWINGDHCNVTGLRRTRRDEPQGEGLWGHPHQAESLYHDQGYQLPPETTMWAEWPSSDVIFISYHIWVIYEPLRPHLFHTFL